MSERVVNAAPGGEANVSRESLYSRRMPGGGSVRVELLVSNPTDVTTERLSGRVVIERRARARSDADRPIVLEELEGDANHVTSELFRIARDNAAIARLLLEQRATSTGDASQPPAARSGISS